MKRKLLWVLLSFVMVIIFVASPKLETYAANIKNNAAIILSGKINEQGELNIDANLSGNTGISGMTLELVYDTNVMTLTNVTFGTALASLEPITTNTETKLGYSITPFRINYMGKVNDETNGKLFTLTFKLDENIKDGNYRVSLKYTKNQDVNYYDSNGEVKTKNLYIDNAEVEIKDNLVIQVVSIREEKSNTWIVVLCVSIGVIAVGTTVAVIILVRKRRNWKRL